MTDADDEANEVRIKLADATYEDVLAYSRKLRSELQLPEREIRWWERVCEALTAAGMQQDPKLRVRDVVPLRLPPEVKHDAM